MPKTSDRSDIGNRWFWAGFVSAPFVAVSVRRTVRLVQVQITPADGRRPGEDRGITQIFIELSFNEFLKAMFRQDRRTPVT